MESSTLEVEIVTETFATETSQMSNCELVMATQDAQLWKHNLDNLRKKV